MATINEIKQQAAAVKNATQVGENTAERVGGALAGLAEIAEQHDSKLSDLSSWNNNTYLENKEFVTSDTYVCYSFKKGTQYKITILSGSISTSYTSNSSNWGEKRVEELTFSNNSCVFTATENARYLTFWITSSKVVTLSITPLNEIFRSSQRSLNNEKRIDAQIYFSGGMMPEYSFTDDDTMHLTLPQYMRIYLSDGSNQIGVNGTSQSTSWDIPVFGSLVFDFDTNKLKVVRRGETVGFNTLLIANNANKIISGAILPYLHKELEKNIINTYSKLSDLSNKLSRLAAIYVGGSEKQIKFTKESVEGVKHIKLYVKGGNVSIRYDNGKRISIDEDQTIDYTNVYDKKMFFVAIDVVTKNFSIKEYNAPLGENEYFLFGFNSIFGANLPLDWVVYDGFDDNILSKKVDNIQKTIDKADSIFTFNPNYIYAPKIATLKKKTPYGYSPKNSPLVLLWFSDLHGNIDNLKRIIEWKDKYSIYIDDILNTGDTITDNIISYNTDYTNYLSNGGNKILKAIGNHDVCASDYTSFKGWSGVPSETTKTIYEKYIAKIEDTSIVKPENAEIGKNYYYKDYAGLGKHDSGIRLIVLDSVINKQSIISSGSGADTSATETYQNEQSRWLSEVLNGAKDKGYSVICAHHYNAKATEFDNGTGFVNRINKLNPSDANSTPADWLDKIDSFENNGGEFICWLCGHVHQDYLSIIDNHPNQIQISIITASTRLDSAESGEPARVWGTKTQDAFNLVAFDTYYKRIRLLRVGCNFDNFGHNMEQICIDYANKKIL